MRNVQYETFKIPLFILKMIIEFRFYIGIRMFKLNSWSTSYGWNAFIFFQSIIENAAVTVAHIVYKRIYNRTLN